MVEPNQPGQDFTGVFGRNCRSYVIFGEFHNRHFHSSSIWRGLNDNQGVRNYTLSRWNKWHHIVCSNGGIGELARTMLTVNLSSLIFDMKEE